MKALVFSDSHGYINTMIKAVEEHGDAALLIHAGDVSRDIDNLLAVYPNLKIETVAGNNEFFCTLPSDRVFEFGGKRIFLTHGHKYGVKGSLARLKMRAAELGADICIFGHTHTRHLSEENGIYFLNPGAAYRGFAVLTVDNGQIEITEKDS